MSLYRTYRPKLFSEIVGQKHIVKTLMNEVKAGELSHAYLFCGQRGTGKTSIAKILARAACCENLRENGDPCNECSPCVSLLENKNPDVFEIDAASNNRVDDVREIRNNVQFAPSFSKFRVFIIDEVHMMTSSAFNALLKTLEEPPAHVIFILATTEPNKLPLTIRSRCQRFDFGRISEDEIANHLISIGKQAGISLEEDAARKIASLSDGAMRDALSLLEQAGAADKNITLEILQTALGIADSSKYKNLADNILDKKTLEAVKATSEIIDCGVSPANFCSELLDVFHDRLMDSLNDSRPQESSGALIEKIEKLSTAQINLRDVINSKIYLESLIVVISS